MTANYLFFSCFSHTKMHPLLQAIRPSQKKRKNSGKRFRPFFFRTDLVTKGRHLVFSSRIYFSHACHNRPALLLGLKIHRSVQTTKTSLAHLYISDLFVFLQP